MVRVLCLPTSGPSRRSPLPTAEKRVIVPSSLVSGLVPVSKWFGPSSTCPRRGPGVP